jgi:DNA polymerase-3 subunit alpha
MRDALKEVKPTEFDDLVALVALYRPGAMNQITTYARGKHDPKSISYADERLRPILESTKGVILFQEQAMRIAKELAAFSGANADELRRAMGKKNREAMARLRLEFGAGCLASGTQEAAIDEIWARMSRSSDFAFNRSHAACYALISYRTAWLRANHPAEYMAALISSVMNTRGKVPFFVAQAEQMGIEFLPPDVNLSDHGFAVVGGNIRFGLDAVAGVSQALVEAITRTRETGGPFVDLWDLCARVDNQVVDKKAIEALIKCGALDLTGAPRKGMLTALEQSFDPAGPPDRHSRKATMSDAFRRASSTASN